MTPLISSNPSDTLVAGLVFGLLIGALGFAVMHYVRTAELRDENRALRKSLAKRDRHPSLRPVDTSWEQHVASSLEQAESEVLRNAERLLESRPYLARVAPVIPLPREASE